MCVLQCTDTSPDATRPPLLPLPQKGGWSVSFHPNLTEDTQTWPRLPGTQINPCVRYVDALREFSKEEQGPRYEG